ncbi:MAG: hypothetical protein HC884_14565 [Chloroflexaceae bacterium]|nr:hypothetical protein [Chloroflexaceae bacterium]
MPPTATSEPYPEPPEATPLPGETTSTPTIETPEYPAPNTAVPEYPAPEEEAPAPPR